MKEYESKKENSRRPLQKVEPVMFVVVGDDVRFRFRRDDHAVDRMKKQREKNAEDLKKQEVRNIVDILHRFFKCRLAIHRLRIREHMHEKKQAERDYARQLVKLTQQKSITKTNSHAETTLSLNFDSWIGSFLQYTAHLQRHKIQNAI